MNGSITSDQSDGGILADQSDASIPTGSEEDQPEGGLGFVIILQITCYGLISILGTIGNCLFLFAMVTTPQLHNPCMGLIANLCITDLLSCIVASPLAIRNNVVSHSYASYPLCKMGHVLTGTFAGVSILTLTVLACNRYVVIVRPHSGYRKYCQMKLVVIYSLLMWVTILPLVVMPIITGSVEFKFKYGCYYSADEYNWMRRTIILAAYVVLPGFILVPLLYVLMLFTVRASANRVMPVDLSTATESSTTTPSRAVSRQRRKRQFPSRQDLRLYKMPMMVLIVYSLCWAPYVIIHIIEGFTPVSENAQRFANICVVSNSAINPYVYALSNKAIHKAYSKILTHS